MSRPKPTILLNFTHPRTYKSDQVLKADAIYAVFYDGAPINLRLVEALMGKTPAKYKKVSFSNSGHAFNLAERLNRLFRTESFTVVRLTHGVTITEGEDE